MIQIEWNWIERATLAMPQAPTKPHLNPNILECPDRLDNNQSQASQLICQSSVDKTCNYIELPNSNLSINGGGEAFLSHPLIAGRGNAGKLIFFFFLPAFMAVNVLVCSCVGSQDGGDEC